MSAKAVPDVFLVHRTHVEAFGLECALLLGRLVEKQRAVDGEDSGFFTCPQDALVSELPFLSRRSIQRHLGTLRAAGVLLAERANPLRPDLRLRLVLPERPKGVGEVQRAVECANLAFTCAPDWRVEEREQQLFVSQETCPSLPNERQIDAKRTQQKEGEAPRSRRVAKAPNSPAELSKGTAIWSAYAHAFRGRYGREPVRNAMVNSLCAQLATRLGDDAPAVAAFFVGHNARRYVEGAHSLRMCVFDAEALHVQWTTGRQITTGTAQQVERRQTTSNTLSALEALYAAKEKSP